MSIFSYTVLGIWVNLQSKINENMKYEALSDFSLCGATE